MRCCIDFNFVINSDYEENLYLESLFRDSSSRDENESIREESSPFLCQIFCNILLVQGEPAAQALSQFFSCVGGCVFIVAY